MSYGSQKLRTKATVTFDEGHELVSNPLLIIPIVADKQVVLLLALMSALARTASVEGGTAVEAAGETLDGKQEVEEYEHDEEESEEGEDNARHVALVERDRHRCHAQIRLGQTNLIARIEYDVTSYCGLASRVSHWRACDWLLREGTSKVARRARLTRTRSYIRPEVDRTASLTCHALRFKYSGRRVEPDGIAAHQLIDEVVHVVGLGAVAVQRVVAQCHIVQELYEEGHRECVTNVVEAF